MAENNGGFTAAKIQTPVSPIDGKRDGGFKGPGALPADVAIARGNGGFTPPGQAGQDPSKRDGGFRRAGEGPSVAALTAMGQAAPAAQAPAPGKAPCEGCGKTVTVAVGAGLKAGLRSKLEQALASLSAFSLSLFDAAILEQPGASTSSAEAHEIHDEPWREAGFTVSAHDGIVQVSSVIGDSPAALAGLDIGDVITGLEDLGGPKTIEAFGIGWRKGDKWASHRVEIQRGGEKRTLAIAN